MIVCKNLSKSFSPLLSKKSFDVLFDINLTIEKGNHYALAGPNGSGKTTLISCMLGLYHATSGIVHINNTHPVNPQSRSKIGFLPEHFSCFGDITPVQALNFYAKMHRQELDQKQAQDWLSRLELDRHQNRKIQTFSKGMLQRLGIISSMIHHPEILVWDEPYSGLDPEGRKLVTDIIHEQKSKGTTFLISTHVLSDVEKTCDHIFILKNGRIILDEGILDACKEQGVGTVEELYLKTIKKESS